MERAVDLVSRMTLAEKAAQMDSSRPPAIPRLGVAAWGWWNEANHGVNALTTTPTGNATTLTNTTSYPSDLSMGSTWNPRPRLPGGRADRRRGPRGRAEQHREPRLLRAHREPLARPAVGPQRRVLERGPDADRRSGLAVRRRAAGPEPAGKLLPPSANGYYKAIATLKHYAANNSEVNRRTGSSDMDQRTLREYYTAQFASIIQQSHPGSIMSSYNEVNGVPAAASVQLMDTLARETFGFNGYFTSDCDAIYEIQAGHQWQPPKAAAPLDQYGRTAFANSAGEDLDCNAGYADQYNYGNTIPTAHRPAHPHPDRRVQRSATSTPRWCDCSPPASKPASSTPQAPVPWVPAARARLGGPDLGQQQRQQRRHRDTGTGSPRRSPVADQSIVMLKNSGATKANGSRLGAAAAEGPELGHVQGRRPGLLRQPDRGLFLGGYSSIQAAAGAGERGQRLPGRQGGRAGHRSGRHVDYLPGVTGGTTGATLTTVDQASIAAAAGYDAVIVVAGTDSSTSAEDHDRTTLALPGAQASMISQVEAANPNTIVYLETVGEVDLSGFQARPRRCCGAPTTASSRAAPSPTS